MKKSILMSSATALLAITMLSSCNTPAQKVENAQQNVSEANQDLEDANEEYTRDMENYRRETNEKIAANNKSIAEFNSRIQDKKNVAKTEYQNTIIALEQKNTDLKKRMDEYKEDGKENWEKFKIEFNHDMEKLGQAFKDLTVKNTN